MIYFVFVLMLTCLEFYLLSLVLIFSLEFCQYLLLVLLCFVFVPYRFLLEQDLCIHKYPLEAYIMSVKKSFFFCLAQLYSLKKIQINIQWMAVLNFQFYTRIFSLCIQIGEVVDGPDDNMKSSVLDGVQYDHGTSCYFYS